MRVAAVQIKFLKQKGTTSYSGGVRSSVGRCSSSAGILGWRIPALIEGTLPVYSGYHSVICRCTQVFVYQGVPGANYGKVRKG